MKCNHTTIQLPLPVDGLTVQIPIDNEHITIVDAIDGDVANLRLTINIAPTSGPYAQWNRLTEKGWRGFRVHRLIMERVLGRQLQSNEAIDHINGNPLDNRRSNLRLANKSQNAANAKRRADNTSGYKGVSWSRVSKKWRAYTREDGRQKHLGLFDTPEQAHDAYKTATVEVYGEFARFK